MSKYVLGKKGVVDSIKQNKVSIVYTKHDFPQLLELKKKHDFIICYKQSDYFNENFKSNHQFIVGLIKNQNFYSDYSNFIQTIEENNNKKKLIVMLDEIQDPGNFGSIIRTCDCLGVDGIIYKKDNQVQINDVVIKTSAGAISSIDMLTVTNLSNTIEKLKNHGYWIISSCLDETSTELKASKLDFDKICLVIGNENNGISKVVLNNSDVKVKIPMLGITQSLNVGVSLGILLYAIKYQ